MEKETPSYTKVMLIHFGSFSTEIVWIPTIYAKLQKELKIKKKNKWLNGWYVGAIYKTNFDKDLIDTYNIAIVTER